MLENKHISILLNLIELLDLFINNIQIILFNVL